MGGIGATEGGKKGLHTSDVKRALSMANQKGGRDCGREKNESGGRSIFPRGRGHLERAEGFLLGREELERRQDEP